MDYITQKLDKYKPVFDVAVETSRVYADRIITLLGEVRDAVTQEEYEEVRKYLTVTVLAPGAGVFPNTIGNMTSGDEWTLEAITVDGAVTLAMTVDDGPVLFRTVAAGPTTVGGQGVLFQGPGQVQVKSTTGGPVTATVQLKMKKRLPKRQAVSAGVRDPRADVGTSLGDLTNGRHGGSWAATKADPPQSQN